jgi:hypothetical protein
MTDQQQAQAAKQRSFDLQQTGRYIDSWSDLVEDMGGKEEEVRQEILKQLQERNMPEIDLEIMQGYVGLGKERRTYVVALADPAMNVVISVRKHGKDLFIKWRTSIASKWNSEILKWAAIIAGGLGLLTGGIRQTSAFLGPTTTKFSLGGWLFATAVILVIEAVILGIAGKQIKGDQMAYFFQQINLFDVEDFAALSLTVHKFVLRSLDNTGIDTSKLRIKQKFSGGRKGEDL